MADIADFGIKFDVNVEGAKEALTAIDDLKRKTEETAKATDELKKAQKELINEQKHGFDEFNKLQDQFISKLTSGQERAFKALMDGGLSGNDYARLQKSLFSHLDIDQQRAFNDVLDARSKAYNRLLSAQSKSENAQKKILEGQKEVQKAEEGAKQAVEEYKKAVIKKSRLDKQYIASTQDVVDKQKQAYKNLLRSAVTFLGSYVAVRKTFSSVMNFAQEGEQLSRMADMAGVSSESIQKLGIALKNYGGSASSASSTLSKLNKQMNDLRMGKGGALQRVVMQYGISTSAKTPEEMLLGIAKRMESLSAIQQVNLGRSLGLDQPTIMLLQQGVEGVRKELEKASDLTVFTKEDVENSQKLNRSYREFQERLSQLKAILLRDLLPYFKAFFDRLVLLTKYLKQNPDLIKKIGATATAVFGALTIALKPVLGWIGLIGSALALLIDDFIGWKNGQDSYFDWTAFEKFIKWIENSIGWVNLLKDAFLAFAGIKIGGLLLQLSNFSNSLVSSQNEIVKMIGLAGKLAVALGTAFAAWEGGKAIGNYIGEQVADKKTEKYRKEYQEQSDKLKNMSDEEKRALLENARKPQENKLLKEEILDKIPENALKGAQFIQQADAFPLNGISQGTISNINNNQQSSSQNIRVDKIEISTQASSPTAIAGEINNIFGGINTNFGTAVQ